MYALAPRACNQGVKRMIPRNLIHLVPSHEGLWPEFRRNLADLAAANPGWTQTILSDAEALDFVRRHYGPRELDALARIDPAYGPARSDLLRYLVLHQLGGVYFDNKSGASRPLDQILRPEDEYLVVQWDNGPTGVDAGCGFHPELSAVEDGEYINWVMISRAGHPFLAAVIDRVLDNIETYSRHRFGVGKDGTLRTTGPIACTLAIHPILHRHPHRRIICTDEGLLYASSGDGSHHTLRHKLHYSRLLHPVVRPAASAPLHEKLAARLTRPLYLGLALLRQQNRRRRDRSRRRRGLNGL
ncbi:hypothetical protein C5F44_09290 [Fuscovulum blasticum DSM 2131]|uniref:Glycosyl transferase n=2 Tax=Fuscovulum blasticum TaxID=1075 RepID=A0A2T4J9Q0_FUSBL|nr:hypothetical protein C5F44_09290 [Fuscovulum blasticum DSM 2131]